MAFVGLAVRLLVLLPLGLVAIWGMMFEFEGSSPFAAYAKVVFAVVVIGAVFAFYRVVTACKAAKHSNQQAQQGAEVKRGKRAP